MTHSYEQRKAVQRQETPKQKSDLNPAQGYPTAFGADLSSSGASGSPVDLPGAIREKFENAFGTDLSAVRLYRSQAVADAGAQAVTVGEKVVFAPGMLDFSSRSGQTLLGHELSHVVSQQRGEVTGAGFLNDPALEARADREGAMAAAGQQITAPTAALSSATAAGASGPMQAKKKSNAQLAASYNTKKSTGQMDADDADADADPRAPLAVDADDGATDANPRAPLAVDADDGATDADPEMENEINNPYESDHHRLTPTAAKPAGFWKHVNKANGLAKAGQGIGGALTGAGNFIASLGDGWYAKHGTWGAGISPGAAGILGGLGMLTGTASFLSTGAATLRDMKNVFAGGSRGDMVANSALTGSALASAASGTMSLIANMTKIPGIHVTKAAGAIAKKVAGGTMMPGLSLISGAANFGAGLYQGIRGAKRKHTIDQQIGELSAIEFNNEQGLTSDQKKMRRTMVQGSQIQKRNRRSGFLKSLGGLLSGIGGATTLGGVTAPVGIALGAAGAAVGAGGGIYNMVKSRSIRRDVLAEELGVDFKHVVADVKQTVGKETKAHITDDRAWKIYLQSRGYSDEKALYAQIRRKRAAHMLKMAKNGSDGDQRMARAFIHAMGVNPMQDGDYAEGALDILTEKLG